MFAFCVCVVVRVKFLLYDVYDKEKKPALIFFLPPLAGETSQQLKILAALAEDPNLIPSTQMVVHSHL